ncbi:hypothetical protein CC1G_15701 [Coprinopsis cinerea okayama7|uniref:Uncharacterized protein n=1 Tax=Coprinopsis cinerea (strain Okayama-7 / 130 / ATCC MYA-4618 / FGSC 9003) TaxID=240176 RepID=D6RQG2_COPC7|nr:hypothetical protein CC1G_15701 [Coprinopsis cinerea okayama7\|eukprot:XP_002910272.1 hypothetical protein CC1G_15701 [Coprinopsis cinerea okayama7\
MPSLSSLPAELISLVIFYVSKFGKGPWERNPLRDLKACSLAWRHFLPHTRPYIFHTIDIPLPFLPSIRSRHRKQAYHKLREIFERTPALASYTRKLVVNWSTTLDSYESTIVYPLAGVILFFDSVQDVSLVAKDVGVWKEIPGFLRRTLWSQILQSRRVHLSVLGFPFASLARLKDWRELSLDVGITYDPETYRQFDDFIRSDFEEPHHLHILRLRRYYQPALDMFFASPFAISFAHLSDLDIQIHTEDQYIICARLLAASQRLETLTIDVDCVAEDDNFEFLPLPLAYINQSSYPHIKHLSLITYHYVDISDPATFVRQYVGLCDSKSTLLYGWPRPAQVGWEALLPQGTIPDSGPSGPQDAVQAISASQNDWDHVLSLAHDPPLLLLFTSLTTLDLTMNLHGSLHELRLSSNWSILDKLLGGFECSLSEPSTSPVSSHKHPPCLCSHTYTFPHLLSVSLHVILRPLRLEDFAVDSTLEADEIIDQTRAFRTLLEDHLKDKSSDGCECGASTALAEKRKKRKKMKVKTLDSYWDRHSGEEAATLGRQDAGVEVESHLPAVLFPLLRSRVFHERERGFAFKTEVELKERLYLREQLGI